VGVCGLHALALQLSGTCAFVPVTLLGRTTDRFDLMK